MAPELLLARSRYNPIHNQAVDKEMVRVATQGRIDKGKPHQVNNFSGTFNTDNGKAFFGGIYNSSGGPMNF